MDGSTSSIVTALGAGSGIDMAALASGLAQAQFSARLERLEARGDALERSVSAAADLKSRIGQLAAALGERVRTGDLAPAPVIGAPQVAEVRRAGAGDPAGSHTLEVLALASAQTLIGPPLADSGATTGSGTLTLRFGTIGPGGLVADPARDPATIAIPAGATLAEVAAAINAAGAGVRAYVAQATDGARLVLKGEEGAASGFVLEAAESPGDPGLAALAWEPLAGDPDRLAAGAADALFEIDGIAMARSANDTGEVAPGLALRLTATNQGVPTLIRFTDPSAAIGSVMQDLAGALNEIVSALNSATDPRSGDLSRDDGARALKRDLASLASATIMPTAPAGAPRTLAELGLATARDGSFRVDSARLDAALEHDPQAASALFTNGIFGVFATIDKIARGASLSSNPGSLAGSVRRYGAMIATIDTQQARIAEQQESLRARLTRQLAAADTRIGASQATLSFIQAQVALWNKDGN